MRISNSPRESLERSAPSTSTPRLASCLFQPRVVLYPQLSTISKVLALQSIVHPSCPLAVQTSPYFLFNSFASRKSDSNTSPRKHKYASARAAFYIVPVLLLHLSSLSEKKFGPQSGLSRKHKQLAAAAAMLDLTFLIQSSQASTTKSLPKIA